MVLTVSGLGAPIAASADDGIDFFESKVRPLLVQHCYECHSVDTGESSGDLLVDSAAGMQTGGMHGPAIVPGDSAASLMIKAIRYDDADMQMPPAGKLDQESIDVLSHWITIGAPDPREGTVIAKATSPIDRDPKTHWTFVTPKQPNAPDHPGRSDRDAIDTWARTAAQSNGIETSPPADDATLVRRLYFDLTGLPPTAEQIRNYTESLRPDRYARLVDSLLASPEFAERFARHWLDVARYADTVGYDFGGKERRIKGSERYRDWVIKAFAADMPYNRMIEHQLAGDRTDPNNIDGNLDAMGFLTLGRKFINGLDITDDRIDVITRGLLGLTVACARCHDHKFDPIPTSDYYSLFGVLNSSRQPDDGASPLMMVDKEKVGDHPILLRGQAGNRGPIAPRQFLTSLRNPDEKPFTEGSGRWELSQRITATDNPLTARVMVNRLWDRLIGKPLVDSPSDFGFRTEAPAVPEVLDELAVAFAKDWSIKRVIRRIVMTGVYQQSSAATDAMIDVDPDNQLLTRGNRKRRDFESLRDSLLCVAGSLDRSMGGPPVEITLSTPTPKRTVYAMIDRQNLPALFRTFDFASPDTHSPKRYFTTVPQQALFLMNSPQMFALAKRTSESIRQTVNEQDIEATVTAVFQQVLRRAPTNNDLAMAIEFLKSPAADVALEIDPRDLWSYGVAKLGDQESVVSFEPLTHFTGDRWQTSETFPHDSPNGYAFLDRENGHTPRANDMAVVRRFTVPFDAKVSIRGQIGHRDQGDGVNVGVWIGGKRRFFTNQKSNQRPIGPIEGKAKSGETIDLVVSPGESDSFDSFFLRATLQLVGDDGRRVETNTVRDFSGPRTDATGEPLDRLAQLAQVLMLSNEFAFVD
ncbi:Planctomycete cytochrome C [Rubripirellula reticaptiva]|uniref:Planctomycete cytochrome C n=2 Tax=Rubripirellula reticaptiva TaxID=2528013 RepID=A0A5C6EQR1_9BACT|nr:Planctomycete cytochrome C [Rubripirellula reticaptiva]